MMRTPERDWVPVGVSSLEPAADRTVRGRSSAIVIAGPGAGKTELLAQRAAFLLQSRACSGQQRILAISFKRDAARNLRDRVERRIGPELASRLDSLTFHAFAKGLLDRLRDGLPLEWRPASDYHLEFGLSGKVRDVLLSIPDAESGLTRSEIEGLPRGFYLSNIVSRSLPLPQPGPRAPVSERAAFAFWRRSLHPRLGAIDFEMITRLAELGLRSNPKIIDALRATYPFVFLDEFQDTTEAQYALVSVGFGGSSCELTAVGDPKQRVMKWAGAKDDVFRGFRDDFRARVELLERNFRSAPSLVSLQHQFARLIEPTISPATSAGAAAVVQGECLLLEYPDHEREAADLATRIDQWMRNDSLQPRDVCILARMRPDRYVAALIGQLAISGRRGRLEAELQDLLAEPLTTGVMDVLRLASSVRFPTSWLRASRLCDLLMDGEIERARTGQRIGEVADQVRALMIAGGQVQDIVQAALALYGERRLQAFFPQYRQGKYFDEQKKGLVNALAAAHRELDWSETLDEVEGVGAIPILTTHKSKGLEYDTVVFVGLEDAAHHGNLDAEQICTFFVALSRAKRRVVFTYSGARPNAYGRLERQSRQAISNLYRTFAAQGVHPISIL